MYRILLCSTLIVLLFITGCTPKLAILEERDQCSSSVEGRYKNTRTWMGETPALIVKDGFDQKVLNGKVLEIRDEGIFFDREQVSPTFDPEPKTYKNDEIIAYVDSNRNVVRGSLPPEEGRSFEMTFFVRPAATQEDTEKRMIFEPNSRFGFCLPPGKYTIEEIHFENTDNGNVDRAVRYGDIYLEVASDSANYLGTIQLNEKSLAQPEVYPIPVEPEKRPQSAVVMGYAFGAVGGIIHDIAIESQDVIAIHSLSTERDPDFDPAASVPLNRSRLHIDPNETLVRKIESARDTTDSK